MLGINEVSQEEEKGAREQEMKWKNMYLDLTLVPLSLLLSLLYHFWLWRTVKLRPHRTYIGMNTIAQRAWFDAMLKDNDKKNILAVQTLRNNIMGSTLMANTAILTCCGLLTFASKIYGDKPHNAFDLGGEDDDNDDDGGQLNVESKFAALLMSYLSVFLCHSLSVVCLTQVNVVINALGPPPTESPSRPPISKAVVLKLLEKGLFLCTAGNRLFFSTLPLMLWIFGPVLVFVCSIGIVAVLYSVDVVCDGEMKAAVQAKMEEDAQSVEP